MRGRFTTTLHVLNSGVLKLAKLQPAIPVYRGITGMKLPKSFTKKNELNVRGGVECARYLLINLVFKLRVVRVVLLGKVH